MKRAYNRKHTRNQLKRRNDAEEETEGACNASDQLQVKDYSYYDYGVIVYLSGICSGSDVERTE